MALYELAVISIPATYNTIKQEVHRYLSNTPLRKRRVSAIILVDG
jgi:hypothetical protein